MAYEMIAIYLVYTLLTVYDGTFSDIRGIGMSKLFFTCMGL